MELPISWMGREAFTDWFVGSPPGLLAKSQDSAQDEDENGQDQQESARHELSVFRVFDGKKDEQNTKQDLHAIRDGEDSGLAQHQRCSKAGGRDEGNLAAGFEETN